MLRRVLYILPLLVFAGMAIYFAVGLQRDPKILPSALIDKPVPKFELPPLMEGVPGLATGDFGGEVAIVNVFASWCVPCRAEHPLITRIAEEGIAPVYGLNWKNEKADAIAWLEELGNPYTRIGWDLSGRAGIEWGVYGIPETYIVDRNGRIRYKHVGPFFADTLNDVIIPKIRELQAE